MQVQAWIQPVQQELQGLGAQPASWRWWRHGPADSGRIERQWRSTLATRHWYGLQHPESPGVEQQPPNDMAARHAPASTSVRRTPFDLCGCTDTCSDALTCCEQQDSKSEERHSPHGGQTCVSLSSRALPGLSGAIMIERVQM